MGRPVPIQNLNLGPISLYGKVSAGQQLAVSIHQKQASLIHEPGSRSDLRYYSYLMFSHLK